MGVSTPHFNAERQKESKTMAKTNTTIKMAEKTPEVTPASSKQSLAKYLADMVKNSAEVVNNTNLVERINYTLGAFKSSANNVPKTELSALVDEVRAVLSAPKKPVEASAKPLKKKSGAKTEKTDEVEKTTDTDKKSPKKSEKAEKPAKTDEGKVQTATPITSKNGSLPSAKIFPKEINHPELGTLVAVPDKYHKYEDIVNALNEVDENGNLMHTIYLATYWSKRQIKEYDYARCYLVPASSIPKNGFPHDLDLLQVVLTLETMKRLFALSAYTEALLTFEDGDLTPVEDVDPADGSKYAIRVAGGLEFEIYVPADEVASK